jgi:hypothetical protein
MLNPCLMLSSSLPLSLALSLSLSLSSPPPSLCLSLSFSLSSLALLSILGRPNGRLTLYPLCPLSLSSLFFRPSLGRPALANAGRMCPRSVSLRGALAGWPERCEGSISALLRLYEGSSKAILKRYAGAITALTPRGAHTTGAQPAWIARRRLRIHE